MCHFLHRICRPIHSFDMAWDFRKKYLVFVLAFLFTAHLHAQNKTYTVVVFDKETAETLGFCYVVVQGKTTSAQSNEKGVVILKALEKDTLVFFQMGYELLKRKVADLSEEGFQVKLKPKRVGLEEVEVLSKKQDTLQGRNSTMFLDFEFYDDFILALVNKGRKYNALLLMDMNGNRITERYLSVTAENLFRDCFDNIQLLGKDSVYQLYYDYVTLQILKGFPIQQYHTHLKPCVCYHQNKVVYKSVTYRELKNTYLLVDPQHKPVSRLLTQAADSEAIKGFNMDFDINYFLSIRRKGAGYFTSVEELKKHLDTFREELVLPENYTRLLAPVQSEMKRVDSNFVLLDYTNKKMRRYSFNGQLQKEINLDDFKDIDPLAHTDTRRNSLIFTTTSSTGLLTLLRYDLQTGRFTQRFTLPDYYFIPRVKIKDGYVYFLHKDRSEALTKSKIIKVGISWEKI